MSILAGIFRTADQADAAMSDFKLRGFSVLREEPCNPSDLEPGRTGDETKESDEIVMSPGIAYASSEEGLGGGRFPMSWGRGAGNSAGWSLFNAYNLTDDQQRAWSETGCTLVAVDAGSNDSVARTVLEMNGAEEIHLLVARESKPESKPE